MPVNIAAALYARLTIPFAFVVMFGCIAIPAPAIAQGPDGCRERLVNKRGEGYWGRGRNCDEEENYRGRRRWSDDDRPRRYRRTYRGGDDRLCRERLVDNRGRGYWGPGRNCDEE